MEGFKVPAIGGRSVLVRPGEEGEAVQLAILSVYGNIIEDARLDRGQLPGVVGALRRSQQIADRDLMDALVRRRQEARVRHEAALARNPWLTLSPTELRKRGLV